MLPAFEALPPVQALDRALEGIAADYGPDTAAFVALTASSIFTAGPTT